MVATQSASRSKNSAEGHPAIWKILFAFGIVYIGYGLNFVAVKIGVESQPAFIFAASHIFCAGILLMLWQTIRSKVELSRKCLVRAATGAFLLFVGGVGLVTQGEKLGVPSGVAAIIKASVPLWVAFLEAIRPGGERVTRSMACGLLVGGGGVALLVLPRLVPGDATGTMPTGIFLLMVSAFLFAVGSIFVRHRAPVESPVTGAAWMMMIGGILLAILGLGLGEFRQIDLESLSPRTMWAFGFLLFVHSLAAFTAMNWLLAHLPASVVTTKFYVSPALALVAGSIVLGEKITLSTVASLALILCGVGVVLWGAARKNRPAPPQGR